MTCAPRTQLARLAAYSVPTLIRTAYTFANLRQTDSNRLTNAGIETLYQIWHALPLNANIRRDDVMVDRQYCRNDEQSRCMQK